MIRVRNTIIETYQKMRRVQLTWKILLVDIRILNAHGGFLGEDYRLFSTDNMSGELTYQRFLNGYPTFNKQDLNEIQVTWGEKGVFDYRRSLLRTDVILNSGDKSHLKVLNLFVQDLLTIVISTSSV